uniref:Metalloendopeptidase n=1 Tax=Plectus sambesii TaxID=2011161 RepID=A0A914V347_9BILA
MSSAARWLTTAVLLCSTIKTSYSAFVINFNSNPFHAKKWPSHEVKYRLSKSFLPDELANIKEAFRQFETYTCLRFIDSPSMAVYDGIYFYRVRDERCRGTVGKQPRNVVYGYRRCWTKVGYILHEIMHNLGFRHEHQRPDRDHYIRLIPDHIQHDKMTFFDRIDDTVKPGYKRHGYKSNSDIRAIFRFPVHLYYAIT